jgi:hypothetical protein
MQMRIRCDCGHEIVTHDTSALVAEARRHAADEHQMEISKERILAIAEPWRNSQKTPPDGLAGRSEIRTTCDLESAGQKENQ